MAKARYPLLIGYATDTGQVRAWCPYCRTWHLHGVPGERIAGKIVGHWTAHCVDPESPMKATGYEVKLLTKADIRAIWGSLKHYG